MGSTFVSLCRRTLPSVNGTSVGQTSSDLRRCQKLHRKTGIFRGSRKRENHWKQDQGLGWMIKQLRAKFHKTDAVR
ncbi:hypothetical protein TNCV_1051541 [Trichonephila clavipes]|nr:hypothetical protein TNCV_1051541 [Trichonephila clavipes]